MKKILLVNDLSCVGKVATVATLPIFSCLQIEADILPTVLLSTHSGGFGQNTRLTLTDAMSQIIEHWHQFNYKNNCILTGYFGDEQQIDTFLTHTIPTSFLAVDPVMGDNGKLYASFSTNYPNYMKKLCQKASIIFPNLTEACLLLNQPYQSDFTPSNIRHLLEQLQQICPNVVLTGVKTSDDTIGVAYIYNGQFGIIQDEYLHHTFFGSGDLFSALVTALLMKDYAIVPAITIALRFIVKSLKTTLALNRPIRLGIAFEPHLHDLIQLNNKGDYND